MKTYRIKAIYTSYCTAEIEAENEEQAHAIAQEMDGSEFEPAEHAGDWRIYDVVEIDE